MSVSSSSDAPTQSLFSTYYDLKGEMKHRGNALELPSQLASALRGEADRNDELRNFLRQRGLLAGTGSEERLIAEVSSTKGTREAKVYTALKAKQYEKWLVTVLQGCHEFAAAQNTKEPQPGQWACSPEVYGCQKSDVMVSNVKVLLESRLGDYLEEERNDDCDDDDIPYADESAYDTWHSQDSWNKFYHSGPLQAAVQGARYARIVNRHSPTRLSRVVICFYDRAIVLLRFTSHAYYQAVFRCEVEEPAPETMLALAMWASENAEEPLVAPEMSNGSLAVQGEKAVRWIGEPRLLFANPSLYGSLTSVWAITAPDGSPKVLKLSWLEEALVDRESQVYAHFAKLDTDGTATFPPPLLSLDESMSGKVAGISSPTSHSLVAVALNGAPLSGLKAAHGLVSHIRAIRDAARAIYWLERQGVFHRGISAGNICKGGELHQEVHRVLDGNWLVRPDEDAQELASEPPLVPELTICLIDFGGAKLAAVPDHQPLLFGTRAFISLAAVQLSEQTDSNTPATYQARFDLESLVNVYHWQLIVFYSIDPTATLEEQAAQLRARKDRLSNWSGVYPVRYPADSVEKSPLAALSKNEALVCKALLIVLRSMFKATEEKRFEDVASKLQSDTQHAEQPSSDWGSLAPELAMAERERKYGWAATFADSPQLDRQLFKQFVTACNDGIKSLKPVSPPPTTT